MLSIAQPHTSQWEVPWTAENSALLRVCKGGASSLILVLTDKSANALHF